VPVVCWQLGSGEEKVFAWGYGNPQLPMTLPPLAALPPPAQDVSMWQSEPPPEPAAAAVAMATLVEYIVATYGRDRLPTLLAALPQHERAETLIPAVFGLPLDDFRRGWLAFLAERYGIVRST
jgi:hypothetical protein